MPVPPSCTGIYEVLEFQTGAGEMSFLVGETEDSETEQLLEHNFQMNFDSGVRVCC